MLAIDSMLHYHNVFDQLRNLVTMPSASAADARDETSATVAPEVPAVPAPAPASPAKAGTPPCPKSEILKAWEKSYSQGRLFFGALNGVPKENGRESQNAHVGNPPTVAALREPVPRPGEPAKFHPQPAPALVLKPCPTLPSTGTATNGQTPVDTTQRNCTGATMLLPSNGIPAPNFRIDDRPRRLETPEPGSLFDIILQNPQTRLFTRPMAWLPDHNRHLSVTFHPLPPVTPTSHPTALTSHYDTNTHADINRIFLPCSRNEAPVADALPALYPQSNLLSLRADPFAEMRLWFDARAYRFALRVECLWRWPHAHDADEGTSFMTETTLDAWSDSADDGPAPRAPEPHCGKPMLAYVGRDWLRGLRSRHMRVPTGANARNDPVTRLCLLQEKQLMPPEPTCDPRFASILIAMAQEHAYPAVLIPARFPGTVPPRMDVEPAFRDVVVRLLVHDTEGDFFVYKATVSADYLRRFHYPLKAFAREGGEMPGLEINVTRVAESPRTGLRERLGAALGEDVVGPLRELDLEWERERLTPDTERWTPMPEDVIPTIENGTGSDDQVDSDAGTPKADGVDGIANGFDADETTNGVLADESASESSKPAGPLPVSSPVNGKRKRVAEIPCRNGTTGGSLDRDAKKRRLSEESTPVVLSN